MAYNDDKFKPDVKTSAKKVKLRLDVKDVVRKRDGADNGEDGGITVLYEDNHLLVVLKPQNVPTQADSSGDEDLLTRLKDYLVKKYNKQGNAYLGLVHRLDRPTGGVMVFAKTSKASKSVRTTASLKRLTPRSWSADLTERAGWNTTWSKTRKPTP